MELGIQGKLERIVTEDMTAAKVGSGGLQVFATPCLIALVEETALKSVLPYLGEGESTVGTQLDIKHLAATPVGMTVRCETVLKEIDRRRLVFACKVYDECELVGEGIHERFIVQNERFLNKVNAKIKA